MFKKSLIYLVLIVSWVHFSSAKVFSSDLKTAEFAGQFYPAEKKELSAMLNGYASSVVTPALKGDILAIIVPHAGYGYSAKTASSSYNLIRGKPYKTVIVIGPSHHYPFSGFSVYAKGTFTTPLGELKVDEGFSRQLIGKSANIVFDKEAFRKEHSVEVQLPFLQNALNDFLIVPVVSGDVTLDNCREFAKLLKSVIGLREDVLIVASTDMYHGYSLKDAEKTDEQALNALKTMDADALYYGLREGSLQLCGGFAVVSTVILSKELGYNNIEVLNHTNSALVTGNNKDGSWVVGYAASVLYRKEDKSMLNSSEKKRLLEIARSTIENYLKTGKALEIKASEPNLLKPGGAFVTLNENGQLRGCIGNMSAKTPLFITVRDMAIQAATEDPRFSPLKAQELNKIKIEVSALSPLEKVDSAEAIQLGTHGVLVRRGFNSGVFLPQVARETGWSKEEFLSNLCTHKAGLEAGAWKDKSTELYIFSAQVFSE
jgi:hypothetical protein